MNIFFDVDNTLITWDVKLRPGVKEVFSKLKEEGHTIYLWSGVGPRWEIVKQFDLHEWVTHCFRKPLYDHHERMVELGVDIPVHFVIDDHQEIIDAFPGTLIEEPKMPLHSDTEMWRVYDTIQEFVAGQA